MTGRIWYAAYGSNLWRERFLVYLTGGPIPRSTAGRIQAGGRDPAPPTADRGHELTHRLFFARSAPGWGGGGVAFLDPSPDTGPPTRVRLWSLTTTQFEDVYRQENGRDEPVPIDLDALADHGTLDTLDTWYGRLLHLGTADGDPIATFTCADPAAVGPERRPHESYESVMTAGLRECWDLSEEEALAYLEHRYP